MEHRELSYPVLVWGEDYVFLAETIQKLERMPRSQLQRLRGQALNGKVRLIDSSGAFFRVDDEVVISTKNPLLRWLVELRTAPLLSDRRELDLDEFKRRIEQAVWARQKGEFDSNFVRELKEALPLAKTYEEALACVPKGM